jgi:hypothetical protein
VLHVERTGDNVKVTVMKMKNGKKLTQAFEYKFEGPFLANCNERVPIRRGRPAADAPAKAANDLYAKIAACLQPHTPIRSDAALKLIGDLIPGAQAVRKVLWQRIRKAMADASWIAVRESDGERRQPPMIERLR